MAKTAAQRQQQKNDYLNAANAKAREIGPLPAVINAKRKNECRLNLRLFCETYYPTVFNRPFCEDHIKYLTILQDAILNGGQSAIGQPRGFGKTAIAQAAAEWALYFGHRSFIVIIAATSKHAKKIRKDIVVNIETNPLLSEDFPEIVYPIRRLEGKNQRTAGQRLNGKPTRISLADNEIVLPTVEGSPASGSQVRTVGITGSIRGMAFVRPSDGQRVRPDFLLIDDPQTRSSAINPTQVDARMNIIASDLLGLGGHDTRISAVAAVTVIATDDVADQLLDRKRNPVWQGVRTKMMRKLPTDLGLWDQYADTYLSCLRDQRPTTAATDFYESHSAAMDAGAHASWEHCFGEGEVSATQHAMNLKIERGDAAFYAEFQNEPVKLQADLGMKLTPDRVTAKIIATPRSVVPDGTLKLTAMVDVQQDVLFWMVVAFRQNFGAHVVDYGSFPEQQRNYFTVKNLQRTLTDDSGGGAIESRIYSGLTKLMDKLMKERSWKDSQAKTYTISRVLIDSGYQKDVVYRFAKESPFKAVLLPSKGRGIGAGQIPMNEYRKEDGVRSGWNWRSRVADSLITYDTNSWKTFVAERVLSPLGDPATLTIFAGDDDIKKSVIAHRMLGDHLSAETPVAVIDKKSGVELNEWNNQLRNENHWWDCLIGAYVAASEQGITFHQHQQVGTPVSTKKKRRLQVSF